MQNKINDIQVESAKAGLAINTCKTKSMGINCRNNPQFTVNSQQIEIVETFTYLGSVIATEDSATKDVLTRINKATIAYSTLQYET